MLLALLLILAGFGSGCATPALWGVKDCSAADQPHLALSFAPEKYDFLVSYTEQRGWSYKPAQTNLYWLFAYTDNRPKNNRPSFVQDTNIAGLTPIQILKPNQPVPQTGYSAVSFSSSGWSTFDLYHDGVDIGRFALPSYSTDRQPANFTRVMLTPPAVIVDTAIVGCTIGTIGFAYGGYVFLK